MNKERENFDTQFYRTEKRLIEKLSVSMFLFQAHVLEEIESIINVSSVSGNDDSSKKQLTTINSETISIISKRKQIAEKIMINMMKKR